MKPVSLVVVVLLLLVAVIHLFRVVFGVSVVIGSTTIPMWTSLIAAIVSAMLGVLLWREGWK